MSPGPITEWLERFHRELPFGAGSRRAYDEVRQHLLDRASQLEAEGLEPAVAQELATQQFGLPEEIATRFIETGGPAMSKTSSRWLFAFAALLATPSVLWFAGVVFGLELGSVPYVLQNSIYPVMQFDPAVYQIALNLLVLGGPFLALGLVLLGATEIGLKRSGSSLEGHFAFHMSKGSVVVGAVSLAMLLVMGGYFILENGPCWWGITWC